MRWFLFTAALLAASSAMAADYTVREVAVERSAAAFRAAYPDAKFFALNNVITRIYGSAFGAGASAEDSAAAFVAQHIGVLGVTPDELVAGNSFNANLSQPMYFDSDTGDYRFTLFYYSQYRAGLPVYGSELRLLVRNEPGNPLVWAGTTLRDLGDFRVEPGALAAIAGDVGHAAALERVADLAFFSAPAPVIWAGLETELAPPALAVEFTADNGRPATGEFQRWRFVADARTGALLHAENLIVHEDVTGTVSGQATVGYGADICNLEVSTRLPYARVTIGPSETFTDRDGFFVFLNGGIDPVTLESRVRGRYFIVDNQAVAESTLAQTVTPPGPANFLHNEGNTQEFIRAEVNAYLHANVVRDFTLEYHPTYPTIATQTDMLVNVNINSTCNAFYDGGAQTINFYRAGGGCPNTAYSSVVHHEFGHHMVATGGSGQGAYGEGMGDVIGMLISDDPRLGLGFQGNCAVGLRTADNTMQYPCSGEIHFCGQLLSGCVWDLRNELLVTNPGTYLEIASRLSVNSIPLHTGNSIAPDITIDYLTLDDTDGDIGNGTPHYNEIAAAFGAHNMPAPPLALLTFTFPSGRPANVSPAGGTRVRVVVQPVAAQPQPGSGQLFVDTGGGFVATAMEQVEPNVYDAVFPAQVCPGTVRYYFSAQTTSAQTVTSPSGAPGVAYSAVSAAALVEALADNFESDLGWTVSNDGALTDGAWQRGVPAGGGLRGDPPSDFDGSGQCFLTANRLGNSDVDGGTTFLVSPTLDLSTADAMISYARWYSNTFGAAPNADTMVVAVSNNNGGTWTTAEVVGPAGPEADGGWYTHSFRIGQLVTPTAQVKVRFVASDLGSGSVVEAAVDAFRVERIECQAQYATGDLNCDGAINNFDIDAFVLALTDEAGYAAAYPSCDRNLADINGDGQVNNFDIDPFVALLTP